jgi:hypothetical protein
VRPEALLLVVGHALVHQSVVQGYFFVDFEIFLEPDHGPAPVWTEKTGLDLPFLTAHLAVPFFVTARHLVALLVRGDSTVLELIFYSADEEPGVLFALEIVTHLTRVGKSGLR